MLFLLPPLVEVDMPFFRLRQFLHPLLAVYASVLQEHIEGEALLMTAAGMSHKRK